MELIRNSDKKQQNSVAKFQKTVLRKKKSSNLRREAIAVATPGGVEIDEDVIELGNSGVEIGIVELQHTAIGFELITGSADR